MTGTRPPAPWAAPLAAALLVLLGGCEDDVDPTLGTDRAFSLYGYLDPTADRQALRVVPIAPALDADPAALDAVVTSVERGTGRAAAWRDSVVTYADGSVGHVFVADYTPTPGATVDVTVAEVGGPEPRSARVTVDVPVLAASEVLAARVFGSAVSYPVEIEGVPNVIGGTLRIHVTGAPGAPTDTTVLDVPTPPIEIEETAPGAWRLAVPFLSATRQYIEQNGLSGQLTLVTAEFAPFVANDAWAIPPGGLDLDAIVEPGTFSNVDGGFGFVGAGYEAPVRWIPSIATQSRAGFRVTVDPAALVAINEVSLTGGWVEFYNPSTEPIELGGYSVRLDGTDDAFEITGSGEVPADGFLVLDTPFQFSLEDRVELVNLRGEGVTSMFIASDASSAYGSYPDGRSLQLPRGGPNLFKGPLRPTRGQPNEVLSKPVSINEIYTAGTDGWVETTPYSSPTSVQIATSEAYVNRGPHPLASSGHAFPTVTESGSAVFTLSQDGGEVFLLAEFPYLATGETIHQVIDYRAYGPQDPTRSVGYLPDGPTGTWREGLVPTRGQANSATGRIASR